MLECPRQLHQRKIMGNGLGASPQSGVEKVARRETSGIEYHVGMRAPEARAGSKTNADPDVSRLATLSAPLRGATCPICAASRQLQNGQSTRGRATLRSIFGFLFALLAVAPTTSTSASLARRTLRIMTYNIHVGVGMDKQQDLQRIADVINQEHPDLVGLQEVDRGVKRTGGVDEIAELARLTKMEYAFAHNLDYQGGQYGVAILSCFPILKVDHRMYENKREAERRGMIRIEVKVNNRTLSFVTTHLDYQYEDGRVFETQQLLEFLKDQKGPLILVGDFNEEPKGEAYKLMTGPFAMRGWIVRRRKPGLVIRPTNR